MSAFTAACICFAPAEIVSGVLLLVVSLLLFRWDQAVSRREDEAEAAASAHSKAAPAPHEPAAP